MRRRSAAALALVVLAGLAGCTDGDAEPRPTSTPDISPSKKPSGDPAILTFGVYGDRETVAAYRNIAATFDAEHPEVTISIQRWRDSETAIADITKKSQAGIAPDVFVLDVTDLPGFVENDEVVPVSTLLEDRGLQFGDDYQRVGLTAFSADSELQCMPSEVSPLVVFYNRAMLRLGQLAQPDEDRPAWDTGWSWDQFVLGAQQMSVSTSGAKGVYLAPDLEQLMPLIRSEGGDVVDDLVEPTQLTLSSEDSLAALQKVFSLVRDSGVSVTRAQIGTQDAVSRFKDGQLGMFLGTRALVPQLREVPGLRFEVFPLPKLGSSASFSQMKGYCISSDSVHVDQAADFIAYAVGPEGARTAATSGAAVPSNLEVLGSDVFLQPGDRPRNSLVFFEGVQQSEPGPYSSEWRDVRERADRVLERLFYDPLVDPVVDAELMLSRLDERSKAVFAGPTTETP